MPTNEIVNGCGLSTEAVLASNHKRRRVFFRAGNERFLTKGRLRRHLPHWLRRCLHRGAAAHVGLTRYWAKDPKIAYRTINARAETVDKAPSYRQAFKKRRCLIPADGFYEWRKTAKPKSQATLERTVLTRIKSRSN